MSLVNASQWYRVGSEACGLTVDYVDVRAYCQPFFRYNFRVTALLHMGIPKFLWFSRLFAILQSMPIFNNAFIKKLYLYNIIRVRPVDFQMLLAKSHP